jgi:AraC-like DNA-binding protein
MPKPITESDPVLPVHFPHVLIETAVEHGAVRAQLFEGTSLTEETLREPDRRLSYAQFMRFEDNALRLTGNPALGLYFGRNLHLSHLGAVALVAMSSPDAGTALRAVLTYQEQFNPGWHIELRLDGERARLIARPKIPRGHLRVFATEALAVGFQGIAREILGRKFAALELRAPYPRPDHHNEYSLFFDQPVVFDCEHSEAVFPASILEQKMIASDPAMAAKAERYARSDAPPPISHGGIVQQVRRVLGSWTEGRPDLDEVARELRTSARTLRRNLHEGGASYQELLDEARRLRAEDWIRFTDMKLEQISSQLGFTDVRSFRRAFKRWTGRTPAELRSSPIASASPERDEP